MTDHAHELRPYARKIVPFFAGDVPAVMLAAADEIERLQGVIAGQYTMSRDDIIRMAGEARAEVGDKPGVTRGKQWVRITPYLELMDTPGMLWPKLENQELAAHLAYLGSIKDEIMDSEALALELLHLLKTLSPAALAERYVEGVSRQEF